MLWVDLQSNSLVKDEEEVAILRKHSLRLLECGCTNALLTILETLRILQEFDETADICEQIIDRAIGIRQREADEVDETRAKIEKRRHSEHKKKVAERKAQAQQADTTSASGDPVSEDEHPEDMRELYTATQVAQAKRKPEDFQYISLGMDPQIWNILIDCAPKKANRNQ